MIRIVKSRSAVSSVGPSFQQASQVWRGRVLRQSSRGAPYKPRRVASEAITPANPVLDACVDTLPAETKNVQAH